MYRFIWYHMKKAMALLIDSIYKQSMSDSIYAYLLVYHLSLHIKRGFICINWNFYLKPVVIYM